MQDVSNHNSDRCDAVQLFQLGRGAPVLLVHGGPGFSHRYLEDALSFLSCAFELISYDQIGCGSRATPPGSITLDALADEFLAVLARLDRHERVQVIAHSWGALIVAASALRPQGRALLGKKVSGGIFINPLPLHHAAFRRSYRSFVQRIALRRQLEIFVRAGLFRDDSGVMDRLWPYYFAPGSAVPGRKPDFNLATYRATVRSLGQFDFRAALPAFERFSILLAEYDATRPELLSEWQKRCRQFTMLPGVGHFPMLERQDIWKCAISGGLVSEPSLQFGNR